MQLIIKIFILATLSIFSIFRLKYISRASDGIVHRETKSVPSRSISNTLGYLEPMAVCTRNSGSVSKPERPDVD